MDPLNKTEIGHRQLRVTRLGFGGAPIGGDRAEVSEEDAISSIRHALELGITYFDTAPLYGHGKSERFYGLSLSQVPRESFVLSTKVGRVLNPVSSTENMAPSGFINPDPFTPVYDYSRDGVMRSLDESLKRLKLDRIDIAMIHDPDELDSARPGGVFRDEKLLIRPTIPKRPTAQAAIGCTPTPRQASPLSCPCVRTSPPR